jgi:hypothetical protein
MPSPANRIAAGVTATSYAHTGLPPSSTRYYLVTAQYGAGESAPSNQAAATTPASPACHVTYNITSHTSNTFQAAITIKNAGSAPINGWSLAWTFGGDQQITQSSNANYIQNGANATLTNIASNPAIAPGATLNGIGINASYSGSNPKPSVFYVNGTLCR